MDAHLSAMESIMWRAASDPMLRMTVGALVVVDQAPSASALRAHLVASAERAPRLRQRPGEVSPTRTRPEWIADDIDVDHHLRFAAAPAPGSLRQVLDLVALFEALPFDPDHPPWDMTRIDGLEGGRAALYFRAHHVVTDGLAGLRLAGALLDESGWPRGLQAGSVPKSRRRAEPSTAEDENEPNDRRPGAFGFDVRKAAEPLVQTVSAARDVNVLDTAVRVFQRGLDVANSVSRQVMVTGGPLSPLFDDRSLMSRFEVISVGDARAAARAFGGSRNDLLVAAAAAGLGLYHERMGTPCSELRLATPATQGHTHEIGGNWFVPARVKIPTTAGHPGPLFGMITERLATARNEPALRLANAVAWTVSRMPTQFVVSALQSQADSVDFAVTALPGLRGRRHICGSAVTAIYPFGPRLGCPVNITALGNGDRLDVGVALDAAAVTEPEVFLECLNEAFATFAAPPRPSVNLAALETEDQPASQ